LHKGSQDDPVYVRNDPDSTDEMTCYDFLGLVKDVGDLPPDSVTLPTPEEGTETADAP
jgi:hypothetical protein